ncbi:putative carbohydrate-binding module family 18 protein [Rosellinia necatrix]|uniref:Putative carbohydrate-binding module family 18 protein n=1 Tax=Rosellinia necatrix TaxID=77044 RepID=A0A1S8AAR6_ROSNE|nr:putative carbohydrate-binding module family 18 protein [Rosellinia necatrix]
MPLSIFKLYSILLATWASRAAANFEIYRYYDEDALVAGLALSRTCLRALNATVRCNEAIVSLLGDGADTHYWTTTDVNNLCTSTCLSSLSTWQNNVEDACAEESIIQGNDIFQAKALPLTFTYNAGLVCMEDSASEWCFLKSQTWQGSDYIRYDPTMCFSDGDDYSVVAPECADADFDIGFITDEMAAMTNLYDHDLVYKTLVFSREEESPTVRKLTRCAAGT